MNVLITHTDLDGVFPIIISRLLRLKYDRIYCWNNEFYINEVLQNSKKITFVDLSISEELFKKLTSEYKEVCIYDHHETSQYLTKYNNPNLIYDENRCGSKIYFDVVAKNKLVRPKLKQFLNLVDVFDRWQDKDRNWENSLNLQRYFTHFVYSNSNALVYDGNKLMNTPYKLFIKKILNKICENKELLDTENDKNIIKLELDKEDKLINHACDNLYIYYDSKDKCFGIYETKGKVSIVANAVLNEFPELDYLIITFPWNLNKISIRSREGFNCLDFEGIKGHKNAAGGTFEPRFITQLYNGCESLKYKD